MAGLSFSVVTSWGRSGILFKTRAQNSGVLQHLAKLLGCRSDDGDEVSLAKPALHTMALQVTARTAMEHRRMRGSDARLAEIQAKLDDLTPIAVVRVERAARTFHRFRFRIGKQFLEVGRLLRKVAVDLAEGCGNFVHDRDAIPDQTKTHAGLQQDETAANLF